MEKNIATEAITKTKGNGICVVKAEHIVKTYPNGVCAVADFTKEFESGRFYAIMGSSGSGKSTLLNMLGSLDIPTQGVIYINEKDIAGMSEKEKAGREGITAVRAIRHGRQGKTLSKRIVRRGTAESLYCKGTGKCPADYSGRRANRKSG